MTLHPAAWWLWATGLAAAASLTTNPLLLLLVVAVAGLTVAVRRPDHAWAGSFRLYLGFAAAIVVVRVLFRVLLGDTVGTGRVLLDLPTVPLPGWVLGIQLLGPVRLPWLMFGVYDGLRLAAIVVCVGAANSLADPKRLLRSMPPALYEVGTALVVAIALLPQLADSLRRVRAARALRGVPGGRISRLRGVVVPVMEDALERSLSLAAGMDARGYGRTGDLSASQRRTTGALLLTGLVGIGAGSYALLDLTIPRPAAWSGLLLGVALAALGFVSAGRRVRRTRYRPDRWRLPEAVVCASGLAVAVGLWLLGGEVATLHPAPGTVPTVTLTELLVVLLGAVAALAAPATASRPAPGLEEGEKVRARAA